MKLIADSGATKTEWRFISDSGETMGFESPGISPYFQNTEQIIVSLKENLLPKIQDTISEITFYGTGCKTETNKKTVRDAFLQFFPDSQIEIEHDLMAVARSLCQNQAGIVCIAGTGSNACKYDGEKIVEQRPNLSFWLGDEGSGGHLGKTLVVDYLHEDLPSGLAKIFQEKYPEVNRDLVLEKVFNTDVASGYFASFAKFVHEHQEHAYVKELIQKSFGDFLDKYVCRLQNWEEYRVYFAGSIAFHYQKKWQEIAEKMGVRIEKIVAKPMEGLVQYHLS